MYGWSSFVAKLDGVDSPPHPKCIGRIHLYSDMWRHFDKGLYLFIQKYIYRQFPEYINLFIEKCTEI